MEQKINKIITIPNILSFFRICLLPVIVWLYSVKHNYIWPGYVLILSGITDIADGYIARRFHMVSNPGKILDPVADKLTQGVMLLCLVLRFPLMAMPFVLMIAKEIFMGVSGIRIIQRMGIVSGAQWHGKMATCFLYGTAVLHVFWHGITHVASMLSLACTASIGVLFGLYGIRNIKLLRCNS